MKKLVIFIPSIESGGVEKNLLYIVEFLSKKHIDIYIVKIKWLCTFHFLLK